MQGWVLMSHADESDYSGGFGYLVGDFYSDIESVCRAITNDTTNTTIVSLTYDNGGEKAMIVSNKGMIYGAYLCKMPMREDVPTKW